MKNRTSASIKALFAVFVWGASFIATKVGLKYLPPLAIIWIRFGLGLAILFIYVVIDHQFVLPKLQDWPYFALLGFLGITFHQWLQSNGLITSQANTTGWIVASMPVFIAILGWLFLKEKLGRLQISGIILAAIGVLIVVSQGNLLALENKGFGAPGDILILLSALNWAVFTALSRRGLETYPAALMMFYVMAFGWLFSSVLFFVSPRWGSIKHIAMDGWLALGFLGVFCSGLAYIFWYDAIKALPVARAGAFLYIEPLVTTIFSLAILHEKITPPGLFGGVIILLGVWMINRKSSA